MSFTYTEYDPDGQATEHHVEETFVPGSGKDTGARTPPDNTASLGPAFYFRSAVPEGKWLLGVSWIREIHPPWRRGFGLAIRLRNLHVIGLWKAGPAPKAPILSDLPAPDLTVTPDKLVTKKD